MKELFEIDNRLEALSVLAEKMEKLAEKWALDMSLTMNINLVLEEALSNIIFYAYKDSKKHTIHISIVLENNNITIEIKDDGIPFDPTSRKEPDITLAAEERPIGGLGILLITKIMDQVSYSREKNQNKLTLVKYIPDK
jgi:serine/threonine-protein kinase RsbW